ncbi:MAG: 6-carboxytetrahydropterin synthase [Gemmataceae bacterium]|nr:6-carboxytetrahydropterin synthase [Gemmataceae bacterium]MDW8265524.1 6-carboxytetrahydropterin synthase [Gemmataceae bacterium]
MFRVSREIHFCYGHRLLNYDGKCRYLHGHNGRAVITLEASHLDELGMVVDFTRIKQVVQTWIDEHLDHKMLLHRDDPLLPYLRQQGEPVVVVDFNPTAENIARLIFEYAAGQGFPVVEVQLWETETCFASYRGSREGIAVDEPGFPAGEALKTERFGKNQRFPA